MNDVALREHVIVHRAPQFGMYHRLHDRVSLAEVRKALAIQVVIYRGQFGNSRGASHL